MAVPCHWALGGGRATSLCIRITSKKEIVGFIELFHLSSSLRSRARGGRFRGLRYHLRATSTAS